MKAWQVVLVLVLGLAGVTTCMKVAKREGAFSSEPRTADACIEKYAPSAKTNELVHVVYGYCRRAFAANVHPTVRARYICYAEGASRVQANLAMQAEGEACSRRFSMPACPEGQRPKDDGTCEPKGPWNDYQPNG